MQFLLKVCLGLILLSASYYTAGYAINDYLKIKKNIYHNFLVGFIFQMIAFEFVALPFMLKKGSLSAVMVCYAVALLLCYAVFCCRIYKIIKKEGLSNLVASWKKAFFDFWKEQFYWKCGFFVLIALHLFASVMFQENAGDDVYYVGMATYAIDHDVMETNTMFITTGIYSQEDIRPNISAWEYYVATLSKAFHIHPAQMFHFVLPLLLIPFYYMAYYGVIVRLFSKEKCFPYVTWYSIISLLFAFSHKVPNYNMFNTIWMGKIVLYNVVLPMLLSFCIDIIKNEKDNLKNWIMIVFLMCAGVCASVSGIYMGPLYYAVIGITYLVTIRNSKELKKLLLPVVLTVIPVVVLAIYVLTGDTGKAIIAYAKVKPPAWSEVAMNYIGLDIRPTLAVAAILLFLICEVMIWIREDKITKLVLCGLTITTCLTLVNPLLIKVVACYLTGADLYWRMFIYIPIVYVLPYLFVTVSLEGKRYVVVKTVAMVLVLAIMGTMFGGVPYFNKPEFEPYTNTYGVPDQTVEVSNYILKKTKGEEVTVLYPAAMRHGLRQYTTRLNTWMGRNYYHGNIPTEYGIMHDVVYNIYQKVYSDEEIYTVLKSLDVSYIVMPKKKKFKNKDLFTKKKRFGKYIIYSVN